MIKKVVLASCVAFSVIAMDSAVKPQNWAEKVIPHLKYFLPEEMASFINAYRKHFVNVKHLLNTQDSKGDTLLHVLLSDTYNVDLFAFVYKQGASIDINNQEGFSVRDLLNTGYFDEFAQAAGIETMPNNEQETTQVTQSVSLLQSLSCLEELPLPPGVYIEVFKQKRGMPFQTLSKK